MKKIECCWLILQKICAMSSNPNQGQSGNRASSATSSNGVNSWGSQSGGRRQSGYKGGSNSSGVGGGAPNQPAKPTTAAPVSQQQPSSNAVKPAVNVWNRKPNLNFAAAASSTQSGGGGATVSATSSTTSSSSSTNQAVNGGAKPTVTSGSRPPTGGQASSYASTAQQAQSTGRAPKLQFGTLPPESTPVQATPAAAAAVVKAVKPDGGVVQPAAPIPSSGKPMSFASATARPQNEPFDIQRVRSAPPQLHELQQQQQGHQQQQAQKSGAVTPADPANKEVKPVPSQQGPPPFYPGQQQPAGNQGQAPYFDPNASSFNPAAFAYHQQVSFMMAMSTYIL
jgi:hypothetical protein